MAKISYTLLFCVLYLGQVCAQTELVLERVEGLSSNDRIEDIEVHKNSVWIASKDGIFTFDNDNSTLSQIIDHGNAMAVKVSNNGSIFSAYNDKTLFYNEDNLIDIETNFKRFKGDNFEFADLEVYKNELWVGSSKGLFIFDLRTKKLKKHYTTENSNLRSNKINFVIYSRNNESLWVGTDDGALEITERTKKWKTEYKGHKMIAATENKDGLWLLSDLELYLMIKGREHPQGLKRGLYQGQVNDLALDKQNNLYVASDILTRFNPYEDKLDQYGENLGLAASKCLALACDKAGALWLGTADAGLYRIYSDSIDLTDLRVSMFLESPITCPGEADAMINVSVSGGTAPYKYLWERARLKGQSNPQNLKSGTYKVTVVDEMGTKGYSTITVSDPKPISNRIVLTKPVTGASRNNGYAVISPKGGTPPYEIKWENGEEGLEAKKLALGSNALVITDANGCSAASAVEITKPKILPDLNIATLKVGQTLRINKLYFEADSSTMSNESFDVLEEVYDFMDENKNVAIEIGGHTNDIPPDEYCDKLSTTRAKTVADFLYSKGILSERITYKGYGKRKPIASNESASGRRKNQRVEIKILRLQG
jgi:outer membrane protein OmpA-like peptidoglycan-associated protein